MLRKITRIFFKTLGILLLILFLSGIALYFGVQSYTFQTWLGKQASAWLSKELKTEVSIEKINLDFFSKAELENILLLDKHKDTILYANLYVNIKNFNYKAQSVTLEKITLKNAVSKVVKYKGEKDFNYGFIEDYFSSEKKDTTKTASQGWDIKFGDVILDNIAFTYRNEKYNTDVSRNMNYDNIAVSQIFGTISNFRMNGDTILASIKNLRAKEQCGIELKNLITEVKLSEKELLCEQVRLTTLYSFVKGTIHFLYNEWDDYNYFDDKAKMNCFLQDSTYASFTDVAHFAEELNGLNEIVFLAGYVKGYVREMSLQNFKLTYGNYTRFHGNLSITGLPDVETSFFHMEAKELSTNYLDLIHIPDYPFTENKKLKFPLELQRLGTISYRGTFDGIYKDFSTYGNFNSDLGTVFAQVSVKIGKKNEDFFYKGKIQTQSFNLGTLLAQRDFNALSMNCEIDGTGTDIKTMQANLKGEISNIAVNRYNYQNILINGSVKDKLFEGLLVCRDANANFDFNGTVDFKNKIPQMDFTAAVRRLRLNELHFTNSSDSGSLSSKVLINISGDNMDNLSGKIKLDSTVYKTKSKTYELEDFFVRLEQTTPDKFIRLNSAYINASMQGRFLLSDLKPAFQNFLFTYYPTFFKKNFSEQFNDEVNFNVKVKDFRTIHDLLLPDVMLSAGTELQGSFNASEKKLYVQANADKASYKNFTVHQLLFFVNEHDSIVTGEICGNALNISDSLALENFLFKINSLNDKLQYALDWDNDKRPRNKANISGGLVFDHDDLAITCDTALITAHDSLWTLAKPSSVLIKKDGSLSVNSFSLHCSNQSLNVSGILSDKIGDSLVVNTHGIILQQFNPLLKDFDLTLSGLMNGDIVLSNVNKNFLFEGDLNLTKLILNENAIGELSLKTNYNNEEKVLLLNGYTSLGFQDEAGNSIKNISFGGKYFPEKPEEALDIDFSAEPANLKLLNPFLTDILTINYAFVSGKGKIHGTPKNVKLDGKFKLFNSEVKVDYTNVVYNATGDIEIMPDQIRFSDIILREKGSKAVATGTLNGNIFHNNFRRIQIDYDITFKNMLALNTTAKENSLYYGKVYATGNMGIYGFINKLNMEINATTNKNSKFVLPLDGPAEIDDGGFIRFVKKDTNTIQKEETHFDGFNLTMNIHATSDATAQIIMDAKTGDILTVQGDGNLDMRINTLGKYEMFGDYFITNGDYVFTLENVLNKKFEIDGGSSISWSGDPMNADINVSTSYRQRVSIAPLMNDTSGQFKTRVPVDCKLLISDKLFSPDIKFAIDFPTLEATTKSRINNILSDEAELNRQVFFFLLLRSFMTPEIYNASGGGVASATGNAAASTGSEMLSSRLSEFMNTYFGALTGLRNLQMGLNYKAATQTANQAVDLTLSQHFFNNKLSVDGNIGMNNNTAARSGNSNNVIGDVNVEYKLSDDGRYRLRAFNRSNDNTQFMNMGGYNTQGIGFFYREEFNTFQELLKRYKDRMKRKK